MNTRLPFAVAIALTTVSGLSCGKNDADTGGKSEQAAAQQRTQVAQAPAPAVDDSAPLPTNDNDVQLGGAPVLEDPPEIPFEEPEAVRADQTAEQADGDEDAPADGRRQSVIEPEAASTPPETTITDSEQNPVPKTGEDPLAETDEREPLEAVVDHSAENVTLDSERRWVAMKAKVVMREGPLEMLVCLKNTKEHESILAVDAQAKYVHTQLLLAGAIAGGTARFVPEHRPATGTEIGIELEWKDKDGNTKRARAQEWVQDARTKKQLKYPWVFAGSQFTDDGYYLAESGDLICVVNFSSATLDLPIPSSDTNEELLFQAFTERIPPVGTEVTIYLKPVKKKDEKSDSDPKENSTEEP